MTVHAQFPAESSALGEFVRQDDAFRAWVRADGSTPYPGAAGRYHLYVSLACPWAHRTIILRKIKKLESAIGMTVVDPIRDERGWAFRDVPGASRDPVNGFTFLREAYSTSEPHYNGRWTVPVLWDRHTRRIVNNSEDDIMRMFNSEFNAWGDAALDLYPLELRADIDRMNEVNYRTLNNGVYRAGFATTQAAYERAVGQVFDTLDLMEDRLSHQRYLVGNRVTETDWRAFVTLVRFDAVYHGHFKCNIRRIVDYPNLFGYLRDLYQYPGVAGTVNFDHIKRHYYCTHDQINPTRIVPVGPDQNLAAPHDRARLG